MCVWGQRERLWEFRGPAAAYPHPVCHPPPPPPRPVPCPRPRRPADYTLAQYKPDTFEGLAHERTVDVLVRCFGYPPALRGLAFDWRYMCRGLIIDKARGNMLKVDRHKYVKLAYHGFAALPREARMATYNTAGARRGPPGGGSGLGWLRALLLAAGGLPAWQRREFGRAEGRDVEARPACCVRGSLYWHTKADS